MAGVEELIEGLTRASAYAGRVGRVETLQTHGSVLFFAGDLVYKVKKPVDLGFLNFSTLERRKRFCEEEVRLNAALAPGVYRRVAPIVRGAGGGLRVDGEGEAVEWAVEMVRLPSARMLDRLLERGDVPEEEIGGIVDGLAEALAGFHASAPTGEGVDEHATAEAVRARVMRNLDEAEGYVGLVGREAAAGGALFDPMLFARVRGFAERFLEEHADALEERVRAGRIREGHGDAHPGNVCAPEGEVGGAAVGVEVGSGRRLVVYDRIEFEISFRCLDVAADLAVTGVGLDSAGRSDLAVRLVDGYARASGDEGVGALQRLYRMHYAVVRAKVDALLSREEEAEEGARREAARRARRWMLLAAGYAVSPSVVLMCGLPATGKSVMAREVGRALRAEALRSDVVRKEMAGVGATERVVGAARERLYSEGMSDRVYERLLEMAEERVGAGEHAVVDATFLTPGRRRAFLEMAARRGIGLAVVVTTASAETVRGRMRARASDRGEPSDADWGVYRSLRDRFIAADETEGAPVVVVEEGEPLEWGAERALQAVVEAEERGVRVEGGGRATGLG